MDNGDYPETSPFYDKENKKVIGKFKDEAAGATITEFVGLRSKMCSYVKEDVVVERQQKGSRRVLLRKTLSIRTIETPFSMASKCTTKGKP